MQLLKFIGDYAIIRSLISHPILSVFLGVVGYCVGLVVYRLYLSPLSGIPGPKLAAATRRWILYYDHYSQRTNKISELHAKYGLTVRIAPNEVSFISTSAVKDIYTGIARESGFPKGYLYTLFTHYGQDNMFSSLTSEEHSWRRRMLANSYSATNILNQEAKRGAIWQIVGKYLECIRREGYKQENIAGYSVDIYPLNTYYASDNITTHIFGKDLGTKALRSPDEYPEVMHQRRFIDDCYVPSRRDRVYLWTDFNLGSRFLDTMESLARKFILALRRQSDPDKSYIGGSAIRHYAYTNILQSRKNISVDLTVAEKLISIKKSESKRLTNLDDYGAASECMDHILAGMDTTGDTLSFLLLTLSLPENHKYQERIRKSLPDLPPYDKPLSVAEISLIMSNPYLNGVIKETLLLFPAIPVTLPRVVPQGGRVVDGYWLPSGTLASSTVQAVNQGLVRNNSTGDEKNLRWNPDRWLCSDDADKERVQELERRLWSFSSGGRGCIGKHLALVEISLLLASILANFKLRQDEDSPISVVQSHWNSRKTFRDVMYLREYKGVVCFEELSEV